jgi:hypothetical protein
MYHTKTLRSAHRVYLCVRTVLTIMSDIHLDNINRLASVAETEMLVIHIITCYGG